MLEFASAFRIRAWSFSGKFWKEAFNAKGGSERQFANERKLCGFFDETKAISVLVFVETSLRLQLLIRNDAVKTS